ncbi:DUF2630 family protein [Sphaerobacter thermophilus]|uniref:Uncharacterized protein n=1 Tax=Sphaerobacter thermophilus (strain ATCC 49802 / DSM 20745 / KCCM 41009 / NCIMB 13125 / S 6022) TaxID=479434 RepID=D1C703_SPHTD|nr:DUF2630 family protein [Sphaerobacter thermophilus]ACZ37764.1 hypothetical protein Sthe_0325 [Sphaerobacter thermophilus DSM 20745]
MSRDDRARLLRRRVPDPDLSVSDVPRGDMPELDEQVEPYGGALRHDSDTLARINALNEERRRLLNAQVYGLAATKRAERLRQIQEELDQLWLKRRLELSQQPGDAPDWLEGDYGAN